MTYVENILTPTELFETAKKMQKFLEEKPEDQEEGLLTRLELLQIMIAKSGKMLSDAKYWLDQRKNDSITIALKEALQNDWGASIVNKKIDALCKDENYLVNLIDRINASATHQQRGLITVISYRKEQMRI